MMRFAASAPGYKQKFPDISRNYTIPFWNWNRSIRSVRLVTSDTPFSY